jgi:hypothetical protein
MPLLLDIAATRAALGGISRSAVYVLLGEGSLEKRKIKRRTLITRESIERIIANGA